MHDIALILHSWVRWVVLITGVMTMVGAFSGTAGRPAKFFTIALDVQFLLGLVLLFTSNVFADFGATMRDSVARFYAVEHGTIMIAAIALAHVGRAKLRKIADPAKARTTALVFFGLATVLIVFGTPWPGIRDSRPLFRL
jgi:hypothetical protein